MRSPPSAVGVRLLLIVAVALIAVNLLALAIRFPLYAAIPAGWLAWRRWSNWYVSDAFGSARMATLGDLLHHGLIDDGRPGQFLGTAAFLDPPDKAEGLRALFSPSLPAALACRMFFAAFCGDWWIRHAVIRTRDEVHTGIFAAAGAGKTAGLLIPGLLADPRNSVVLDPQGAIFKHTAEHRRRRFGHEIVRLDSAAVCGPGGGGLNPFDYLQPDSPTLYNDCRNLANQIVVRKGTEPEPYWNNRAEDVLTCFIYYVARFETNPARRNLLTVRQAVNSRDAFMASVNVMQQLPGLAKDLGDSMTWLQEKELNSVQGVVASHINWMASPIVAASLQQSSFDINKLKSGRMTVYIIEHPSSLETNAGHLRVMLGTILGVTTRGEASEAHPIRYVIDETAALGRMKVLESAVTQLRGYGVRLVLTFQSVAQLRTCYGDNAQTILDNLGTQLYFGIRSYETLEQVSKLLGDTTISLRSINTTEGTSHPTGGVGGGGGEGSRSDSTSTTISETGRSLLKPDEIRQLIPLLALLFHKHLPPTAVKLEPHFASPLFKGGGLGRRGLGMAGGVAAGLFLCIGLALSALVADLPPPARRPAPVKTAPVATAAATRPVAAVTRTPGRYPPPGVPRHRKGRRAGPSGYLIPIR